MIGICNAENITLGDLSFEVTNDEFTLRKSTDGTFFTTLKSTAGEGRIKLLLTKNFYSGQSVDYDIVYKSGTGNRMSRIIINGVYLDVHSQLCCWRGAIGFWDKPMGFGNMLGTYHVNIKFRSGNTTIIVSNPNGGRITERIIELSEPYSFGIGTATGHNGAINVRYHNFTIR